MANRFDRWSICQKKVTWFRSGESVGNDEGDKQQHQVVPSTRIGTLVMANGLKHVLRFKSVRDADLGVYTCRAENPHGRAEAAVEMSGNKISPLLLVTRHCYMLLHYTTSLCYHFPSSIIFFGKGSAIVM